MTKYLSLLILSFLFACGGKKDKKDEAAQTPQTPPHEAAQTPPAACVVTERSQLDTQEGGTLLVKVENQNLTPCLLEAKIPRKDGVKFSPVKDGDKLYLAAVGLEKGNYDVIVTYKGTQLGLTEESGNTAENLAKASSGNIVSPAAITEVSLTLTKPGSIKGNVSLDGKTDYTGVDCFIPGT